eukprot:TRINITY_DN9411_c3_g1_i1.p1 TRINITY_DN9411_c3_g1~~TRINITY_DN9411_c3_g1_i1.p1  ORF type:complete len:564 (+),score=89.39 TRINITY_DN9411_c3_g1_i1:82-1773(+)
MPQRVTVNCQHTMTISADIMQPKPSVADRSSCASSSSSSSHQRNQSSRCKGNKSGRLQYVSDACSFASQVEPRSVATPMRKRRFPEQSEAIANAVTPADRPPLPSQPAAAGFAGLQRNAKPFSRPALELKNRSGLLGAACGRCSKTKNQAAISRKGQGTAKASLPCMEAALYNILSKMPAPMRRSTLRQRFSESQRRQLEAWLIRRQHRDNGDSIKKTTGMLLTSSAPEASTSESRDDEASGRSGIVGVQSRKKCGKLSYCASIVAGPLTLCTKYHHDLATVQRYQLSLQAIQRRISGPWESLRPDGADLHLDWLERTKRLEAVFKTAIVEESTADPVDMDIRFTAVVSAKYWVGTALKSPQFKDIDAGLAAWRRLHEARSQIFRGRTNRFSILSRHSPADLEDTWQRLRAAYIDVWVEAGKSRCDVDARLQSLEEKHKACRERLLARWQRAQQQTTMYKSQKEKAAPPGSKQWVAKSHRTTRKSEIRISADDDGVEDCDRLAQEAVKLLARWTVQRAPPSSNNAEASHKRRCSPLGQDRRLRRRCDGRSGDAKTQQGAQVSC